MSIAPVNFYSSYGLVPIFEWMPVEPTGDATTAFGAASVRLAEQSRTCRPDEVVASTQTDRKSVV